MKKLNLKCPAFAGRLWWRLALSYSILTFFAMAVLMVISGSVWDCSDFHKIVTPANIEKVVSSEQLSLAQAVGDKGTTKWLNQARDNIREKLKNLEHDNGGMIYRITSSSIPEVYIQIRDKHDQVLISEPAYFPEEQAKVFATQEILAATASSVKLLPQKGHIWVDLPVTDADQKIIGRVRVLFIATFNLWIELQSGLDFVLNAWIILITSSIPIGTACGLIAARYVNRRLKKMNEITERWRQGNFDARITLPNDDELTKHSQHLNDMAQDLELFLSLKQNIAVGDERNRVARELHDTVKQKLFALGLQLAVAKSKPAVMEAAAEHILEAETITREAQHDLMEIITQLRPSGTHETSLYERIGVIADDFKRRFNVDIQLIRTEVTPCATQTEHHVLRIVQEALMNAVRHGKASKISIASHIDQDMTMLVISDNGGGFDTTQKNTGFGITSMRDRVRDLPHGKFEIKSSSGQGTQITISWKNEL